VFSLHGVKCVGCARTILQAIQARLVEWVGGYVGERMSGSAVGGDGGGGDGGGGGGARPVGCPIAAQATDQNHSTCRANPFSSSYFLYRFFPH